MASLRALTGASVLLAVLLCAPATAAQHDVLYDLTDEQYYSMPVLFSLDEWASCRGVGGAYCVGTFELVPENTHAQLLYDMMQRYSANWVDHFNHTRLHRGVCLPRQCASMAPRPAPTPAARQDQLQTWFSACVNASTSLSYNLSARLYKLDYCTEGAEPRGTEPLSSSQRAFAVFLATMLALTTLSTVLEVTLSDHAKKGMSWALSWSLQGSWRLLQAAPGGSSRTDLRAFEGLRVLTMAVVIVEHVTWITTHAYLSDPRTYEQIRRDVDVVLLANSTLVVQIFFIMSSFLLAHKLLQQRRRGENVPLIRTFIETMVNRIIRVSPSYFVVVWFAASWWERLGSGPLWQPLVVSEAAVCRQKWWTHLLYLNNVLYADDKCLIQTWYLAADTQLYALCLALTLLAWRWRGRGGTLAALGLQAALLGGALAALGACAYTWRLLPTRAMHRPESVRVSYRHDSSFNVLYQSPLANVPGALAGLLLAHLHHALLDHDIQLHRHKIFSWVSVLSVPAAAWWVARSPLVLGAGPPGRAGAAALAVLERPVFALLTSLALLGAMNNVPSAARRVLSWRGWSCCARLSYGALLLHMPINKALVAARHTPSPLDRPSAIVEWFGVAGVSYVAALLLALLVELPAARLHRALACAPAVCASAAACPATTDKQRAADKPDM